MQRLMSPRGFLFVVTMKYPEGLISRVAFYALDLALEKVPVQAGRLRDFLDVAPVYDARPAANYSWPFGRGPVFYYDSTHASTPLVQSTYSRSSLAATVK